MKIIIPFLSLLVTCAAFGSPARSQEPYTVVLKAPAEIVPGGKDVRLDLEITINKDCEVPLTLLSGVHLECTVDGKPGAVIKSTFNKKVLLAAGTFIRRVLNVPFDKIGAHPKNDGLTRLSFTWPDIEGAHATMQVTPDVSELSIDDLDLKKTSVLLVTNYGTMTVRFYPDKAPNHVRNFIELSKDGFYNGTRFHRVIRGFMLQGGCPNTKEGATDRPGTGDSGQRIKLEPNDIKHRRGILSMARGPDKNSASSQFFVMHGDAPHLDGGYSAFGFLEKGADTLDQIASVPTGRSSQGAPDAPMQPVHLYYAAVLPVRK